MEQKIKISDAALNFRFGIFAIMLLFWVNGFGQFVSLVNIEIPKLKNSHSNDTSFIIQGKNKISGVSIRIHKNQTFKNTFIVYGKDTFFLNHDPHGMEDEDSIFCYPVVFEQKADSFILNPGKIFGNITVFLLNSGTFQFEDEIQYLKSKASENCDMPNMVDQEIWRAGLPSPSYSRLAHTVHNMIVHHSATSNSSTNYTDVVRNIYLYHTQTRGWSDIGYNYVVAQDGTIYKGRDPNGYEQDKVMGAHFCASNTGTMGICILGDYTDFSPTDTSISSLEKLLAWKASKDSLDPTGIYSHALNSSLNVISGHRDGCATICPGNGIYYQLPDIRLNVKDILEQCHSETPEYSEISVNPTVFSNEIFIHSPEPVYKTEIFDISGKILYSVRIDDLKDFKLSPAVTVAGIYFIRIKTRLQIRTFKVFCASNL